MRLNLEGPEGAEGNLAESAAGVGTPLASYQALCGVLLTLGRYDEAVDAAGRWVETAEAGKARAGRVLRV
ncbi:MAG TPA: hypothetical protein VMZ06_07150 [Candidatus Bathyarchaeia archaeon]|nr:hypothetical protein [Candidatus Bathyarchaeia archaeon]